MSHVIKKVMVSSTVRDLPDHRKEVLVACLSVGMFPIMMEHLPPSDSEALSKSLELVNQADIYVGVFAHRYGSIAAEHNPDQISVTEMEYNRAVERKIPRLILIMHDDHLLKAGDVELGIGAKKLATFKARLLKDNIVNFFKSPENLGGQVIHGLSDHRVETETFVRYESDISDKFLARTKKTIENGLLTITGLNQTLPREEVERIEDQLEIGKPILLVGEPGSGKTGIGLLSARRAVEDGKTVVYVDSRNLLHIADGADLDRFYGLASPLLYSIIEVMRHRKVRLIIDQLDNAIGRPVAQLIVDFAVEASRVSGLEVVVISRYREGHESRLLRRLTDRKFVELQCHEMSSAQSRGLLTELGIHSPTSELVQLATNLLNLEIIAIIKQKWPDREFSNALDEVALWEAFLETMVGRDEAASAAESFHDAQFAPVEASRLAQRAVESDSLMFDLEEPLSVIHRRLESWGIIARVDGRIYQFRHEKLQDYLYARLAADMGWMPRDVLARISPLKSRSILLWMDKIYRHRQSPFLVQWLKEALDV